MNANKYKYINLSYLNEVAEGNKDLIIELIEIYKSQIPEFIELFNTYLNSSNWYQIGLVAHKAKSSVAVIGMKKLAEDLNKLETLSKNSEHTELYKNYIDEFSNYTKYADDELNDYLSNL
ncbi:MAG: hypothetical protein A2046_02910 [Bacteroidetes bacterium GWA2_30_7]|nr:MAG: hypothetical protein A2046_02910 [Bacteroidetes bacterium GWA2_30_7]